MRFKSLQTWCPYEISNAGDGKNFNNKIVILTLRNTNRDIGIIETMLEAIGSQTSTQTTISTTSLTSTGASSHHVGLRTSSRADNTSAPPTTRTSSSEAHYGPTSSSEATPPPPTFSPPSPVSRSQPRKRRWDYSSDSAHTECTEPQDRRTEPTTTETFRKLPE